MRLAVVDILLFVFDLGVYVYCGTAYKEVHERFRLLSLS